MDIRKLARPGIEDIGRYEPGEDGDDHVKLSSNENPLPPPEPVIEAIVAAARESNRYPVSGSPRLTAALAKHHGVDTREILVGAGSNEIIDLLIRAFVPEGCNVVHPVPSFIVYGLIPKICGVGAIGVPCKDYRLDLAAMRAAINVDTRIVFICNPNNPTSTYVNASEVSEFIQDLRDDLLIVMDEAYYEYVNAADYPDTIALRRERNTIVTLRTFSKFYSLAGIRVGYAIGDPELIDILHRIRQPFNVSTIAQAAALAALQQSGTLQTISRETHVERERIREVFLSYGVACPASQTNFVFVDMLDSDIDLHGQLRAEGVLVRRMGQFGSGGNTYRVTIGTPAENSKLITALERVFGSVHPA